MFSRENFTQTRILVMVVTCNKKRPPGFPDGRFDVDPAQYSFQIFHSRLRRCPLQNRLPDLGRDKEMGCLTLFELAPGIPSAT